MGHQWIQAVHLECIGSRYLYCLWNQQSGCGAAKRHERGRGAQGHSGHALSAHLHLHGSTWLRRGRSGIQRSEEHTSELQSLMRISYDDFCLKRKNTKKKHHAKVKMKMHTTGHAVHRTDN